MEDSPVVSLEGSSIGDAVSGRGDAILFEEGEEDLYYIPERRPSLDLGPTPMDTSQWYFVEQALTPAQSYSSMSSEERRQEMDDVEDETATRLQLQRADSYSSCYSLDSDDCEKRIPKVKEKEEASESFVKLELIQDPDEIKHPSLTVGFTLTTICEALKKLQQGEFKAFKWDLWTYYPQFFSSAQRMDIVDVADRLLECFSREESLQITKTLLVKMGRNKESKDVQTTCIRNEVRYELGETLRSKYGVVCEDLDMKGERRCFDDVYADLCLLSPGDNGPNTEHEVISVPKLNTKRKPAEKISVSDIMSVKMQEESYTRLVLLTGVAGSGKSMLVRRLVLDWVEGRSHKDLDFVLPFSFRELKQFEGSKVSLLDVVHTIYPETKKLDNEDFKCYDCKVMFIFDGLDEYSGDVDFMNTEIFSDPEEPTKLNIIVANLLRDRLLYRALCFFTSRPQVKDCIPWDTHYTEIELQGFLDPDKDDYFKKRFKDQSQAAQVIEYVKSYKTLHIMCHLPLFCALVADECERIFREQGTLAGLPKGITYMYTKLLLALIRHYRRFRAPDLKSGEEPEFLLKLGKLALKMLEEGKFQILKTDWPDISAEEAVVNGGLCMEYVIVPYVLLHEKVLSFIHPTLQEYLAALYAYLSFRNQDKNIFEQRIKSKFKGIFKGHKIMELYKGAVEHSLQYHDGKLDIFLRFLFGMAQQTNQGLLSFCNSAKLENFAEDAANLIRKKIKENQFPNRNSNLQKCLEELNV